MQSSFIKEIIKKVSDKTKIVTNPENKLSHSNQNNLLVNKQKAVFQFEDPGHISML